MDFLKEILGEGLYAQVSEKINAYNGNEANKDKQIKLANLGGGEYVGKAKHDALQALLDGKTAELETANNLIVDLKKSTKGNEGLQQKITDYEGQVQTLQAQLAQAKLDSAVNVGLLAAGVKPDDIDYVAFKLKQKGELSLDENEKIKGWDDKLAALKTQLPAQFEGSGQKKYQEHKLDHSDDHDGGISKESFAKMGYQDRLKLFNENPAAYAEMTKS